MKKIKRLKLKLQKQSQLQKQKQSQLQKQKQTLLQKQKRLQKKLAKSNLKLYKYKESTYDYKFI